MLNEEKVKSMTKAAAYENGPKKENLKINQYFRSDYLGLQLIKSLFAYVASFCILVAIWFMLGSEEVLLQVTRGDYLQKILKILLIVFVAGLVLYESAIYIYYSRKYRLTQGSLEGYQGYLKKIGKFYETEESAETEMVEINLADEENTL